MIRGKGAEGNVHAVCREVSRVLRPGGRFLVVSHATTGRRSSRRVGADAGDARRAFGWTLERAKVPKPQTDQALDGALLRHRHADRGRAAVAGRAQGRRPEGLLAGRAGGAAAARERAGLTNLLFLNLESSVGEPSARWRGGRRSGQSLGRRGARAPGPKNLVHGNIYRAARRKTTSLKGRCRGLTTALRVSLLQTARVLCT